MPETARTSQSRSKIARLERLSFESIPGQNRLFLDYLNNPAALRDHYPNFVESFDQLSRYVPTVLESHKTDRQMLGDILAKQNLAFGCGRSTIENIDLLRARDCVAILTGQQAGLFTGPLYAIYKAVTVISAAERLRQQGVNAVPVFWIATEDHDINEVSSTFTISEDGRLADIRIDFSRATAGKPVGGIEFGDSIDRSVSELLDSLARTEFTSELIDTIRIAYSKSETYGTSFGKLVTSLFAKYGLILFDPLDAAAKQLAAPIFRTSIERSEEIVEAVIDRSKKLVADGYHAQVLVGPDHFPFLWFDTEGVRRPLKRIEKGRFRASGTKKDFDLSELLEIADKRPYELSPGVMLRPAVQDFMFPTLCYFGGAAEIAYFAQNREVYRILERPVTPILARQSFTVVEPKHARTMTRYGLSSEDVFEGVDRLRPRIVESVIDPETPRIFADVEEKINAELGRLDNRLSLIDPTLSSALAKRRRKIIYHIGAMRGKFQRARLEKSEIIDRQIGSMFDALTPQGGLQERKLNVSVFMNRYGEHFIGRVFEAVDIDNKDHVFLYL